MNEILPAGLKAQSAVSLTHQLARHAVETPYEAIPQEAREAAKLFLLDTLAVAWAGSNAPGCREALALLVDEGGRKDSTAWVYGGKLPAMAAAFINGMTSSALDYDSIGHGAAVHANIVVVPAALAIAEKQRVSGKDFLAALVIGIDILYRMAASSKKPPRGFHFTGALGGFGAAAAASRLMGLDAVTTRHALGIAFGQASGTQQANIEPSLSKRMLSAFGARAGVYAALLAQRGITAPGSVIEGKFGIYQLYQDGEPDKLVEELGHRFDNGHFSIKIYPSCGCNHTTLDATLDLVREHDLKPDDVLSVEVTVPPYIDRIVGGAYDPSGDAQVAAQFNLRYSVACALVRRKLGMAEIQESAARDPLIAAHIGKVSMKVDPALTRNRGPVVVRMVTRTHGEISRRVEDVRGSSAGLPVTAAESSAKFAECFGIGVRPLDAAAQARLTQRVREIESFPDMSKFFEGVC